MAQAAAIAGLVGGGLGAYGALKSGQSAEAAGRYNQDIANINSAEARYQGHLAVQKQQIKARKTIGSAKAQYAASGVDTGQGSALDILQESATNAAYDSLMIQHEYDAKAYGYSMSGELARFEGDKARESSYYSAAGSLLGGVGSFAGGMKG